MKPEQSSNEKRTIKIRGVKQDVRRKLAAQAKLRGLTQAEYLELLINGPKK
ncbi:hypothetical protein LCGC14_2028460 [marine sediment metagenome]|uniref:Ribbon-helix-helix protein CopG domain-containing protein n=1 Tax=marine sediment metagenome TaxID=412755 RepID=A0A0F9EVH4_9ZZZZ